jgi:hypothetical protein
MQNDLFSNICLFRQSKSFPTEEQPLAQKKKKMDIQLLHHAIIPLIRDQYEKEEIIIAHAPNVEYSTDIHL